MHVLPIYKLARLVVRFRSIVEPRAGVKVQPDRQRALQDFFFAAQKIQLRKLADNHLISSFHALVLDVAVEHREKPIAVPVLGDESDRVRLRIDGLAEAFRKGLPEQEGSEVVDLASRQPAVPQIGFAVKSE